MQQQDCPEFLSAMLNVLTEDERSSCARNTFMQSNQLVDQCQGCSNIVRKQFEDLPIMMLNIPSTGGSLVHCYKETFCHTNQETWEGACDCSAGLVQFRRINMVTGESPGLIIQLKRFNNNMQKISTPVDIPMSYCLDSAVANYDFRAAIIHIGDRAGSGHYITVLRHGQKFYEINDSEVKEIAQVYAVARLQSAYMLFYEQKESDRPEKKRPKSEQAPYKQTGGLHDDFFNEIIEGRVHVPFDKLDKDNCIRLLKKFDLEFNFLESRKMLQTTLNEHLAEEIYKRCNDMEKFKSLMSHIGLKNTKFAKEKCAVVRGISFRNIFKSKKNTGGVVEESVKVTCMRADYSSARKGNK